MSRGPTVMFCVGAAKAGTSWLHRYLSDHPDTHFRSIKELHYFDALDRGQVGRQLGETEARAEGYRHDLPGAGPHRLANRLRQIADCEDWAQVLRRGEDGAAYLGYLTQGAEGRLVGDMTPAYALLSEERLRSMAGLAPDVRFVYLLRDPVERLWSHVRMMAERRARKDGRIDGRASHILGRVFRGKESEIEARGDYRAALTKLGNAVPAGRLFIGFYERITSVPGVIELCRFLGIRAVEPDAGRRVNAAPSVEMSPDERARARAWLADQYDFVADLLGARPQGWQYDLQRV